MAWYIYIVRCADNSLYTGITTNLELRVRMHNLGKAAKYTAARLPVQLVWHEATSNRSTATKRELEIKKLSREEKIRLINK